MTDVEQWEPTSTNEAMAVLNDLSPALDRAETVEELTRLRNMAEIAMAYVRRHDEAQVTILRAQEIMRQAERKLAELMAELKAAGKVRGAGRPRKQPVNDSQVSDEEPVNDSQVSVREVFGDSQVQRDAALFASVNEDEWHEALEAAREAGDMSRKALVRMLRTPREERASNGRTPPNVGNVVPRVIKGLTGFADSLELFNAAEVEHENRKEWRGDLKAQIDRLSAWQKALPAR